MEYIFLLIALLTYLYMSFMKKQLLIKEESMSCENFVMKYPKSIPIIIFFCSLFLIAKGNKIISSSPEYGPAENGYFLIFAALVTMIVGVFIRSYKVQIDKQKIIISKFFMLTRKQMHFKDINYINHVDSIKSSYVSIYSDEEPWSLSVSSSLACFNLLLKRLKELDCEFVEKTKF